MESDEIQKKKEELSIICSLLRKNPYLLKTRIHLILISRVTQGRAEMIKVFDMNDIGGRKWIL